MQTETLNAGVDVLIATPGRLLNHHERRSLNLSNTAALVMDEVDVLAGEGRSINNTVSNNVAFQEFGQHPAPVAQHPVKSAYESSVRNPMVVGMCRMGSKRVARGTGCRHTLQGVARAYGIGFVGDILAGGPCVRMHNAVAQQQMACAGW